MSGVKQRILKGISNSGLQDWAFMLDEYDGIVDYERVTDEDIDELATYILDEIIKKPTLNENQQIVLAWFKKEYAERNLFPTEVAWLLLESFDNGYFEPEEERAFENLNELQEAQVLQAFATWVEQEAE